MRKKPSKKENKLQTQVSDFLRAQHPNVEFCCDLAAGIKLTMNMAVIAKRWRSHSGFPDMTIFCKSGQWSLLMLELKAESAALWKKDGTLRKNDHLENQQAMHVKLRNNGYYACFGYGFDHCRAIIDWYMEGCVGEPPKYIKKNLPKLF